MLDRHEFDAHMCEQLNKTEKGKMVLCESKENDSTRLFVHRFSSWADFVTRNGWWDTFTISNTTCKTGYWLCVIDSFRIDRNGYLNMLVTPKKHLGESVDDESIAWDFFYSLGIFCSEYNTSHACARFNTECLFELFKDEFVNIQQDTAYPMYKTKGMIIFNKFLNDETNLETIEKALDEKMPIEKLVDEIGDCLRSRKIDDKFKNYELIFEKLRNAVGQYPTSYNIQSWVMRKYWEYDDLKLGTETDYLKRIMAVLQYWVNKNAQDKEARKAARKAKKNQG